MREPTYKPPNAQPELAHPQYIGRRLKPNEHLRDCLINTNDVSNMDCLELNPDRTQQVLNLICVNTQWHSGSLTTTITASFNSSSLNYFVPDSLVMSLYLGISSIERKSNFWPPIDASYIKPPFAIVNTAIPL